MITPVSRKILITGAAGNLGGLLARHLASGGHHLRLMYHKRQLPRDLTEAPHVETIRVDLADPASLLPAVKDVTTAVHFAGVLFAPRPERFLPETNTRWFANLLDACLQEQLARVILISFPHVEGPTSIDHPATGRLDATPISVHARTRLEEERLLMHGTAGTTTVPVILRLGMVYGRGILMIDAARWLSKHHMLAVWKEPTWFQLISTIDYLRATEAAILKPNIEGIYHVGDEQPVTLQNFLREASKIWGCSPPKRLPVWMIFAAAWLCELFAMLTGSRSPLTRDFIRIGQVSHWGDTSRFRSELLSHLEYPTLESGLATL